MWTLLLGNLSSLFDANTHSWKDKENTILLCVENTFLKTFHTLLQRVSGVESCQEQGQKDTDIDSPVLGIRQDQGLGEEDFNRPDQCVTLGPNKLVYTFLVAQFLVSTGEPPASC